MPQGRSARLLAWAFSRAQPALTIYRKRAVNVETERKPKIRTTEITADEFYVAVLSNEAKVVLAKFKA